ncbi:hypothetical protein ACP70R_008090 [Stipagrostis hirtigluma subsp. patula]
MALWNGVGQVGSITQLAGVDALGLISMIVEAAQTVKRNRETCQLLARRVRMIGDLLHQLQSTQLMQHMETRNPLEQLEETLRHAYVLIASCQDCSYLHSCFMGGKQAEQLHEVQNEITFYLQLFPLVSFVDTTRTWELLMNRNHNSCSEATTDELHTVHRLGQEDSRIRREALKAIEVQDLETLLPSEYEEDKIASQIMSAEEIANLIVVGKGAGLSYFSFSQILVSTNSLSWRKLIGNGGFGYIYKLLYLGKLPNGHDIAVKRHKESSKQGPAEFKTEIETIASLQHENIITLLGFCVQGEEKILVYEFMPNKSLASVIADDTKRKLLNWSKRLRIIEGIANGLAYLHGHLETSIVHRDIKASNILLDNEMNAKISDFGLAMKLAPNTTAELSVCGTYGYVDPEYIATGRISEKADVYSFGIVLLEVISGKLNCSHEMKAKGIYLPDDACVYQKKLHKFIDPFLDATKHDRAQIKQCVKVGLLCIRQCAKDRPTMSEVVAMLCGIKVVRK